MSESVHEARCVEGADGTRCATCSGDALIAQFCWHRGFQRKLSNRSGEAKLVPKKPAGCPKAASISFRVDDEGRRGPRAATAFLVAAHTGRPDAAVCH